MASSLAGKLASLPYVVALTGGIGSGKSSASKGFAALGVDVIDTDALAHALTAPNGAAIPAIEAAFGADMIEADGRMNRAKMRERVFANAAEKTRLESIIHPLIGNASRTALQSAKSRYVIVDVPLLAETANSPTGWARNAQRILVIDCPIETQIERVITRSNGTLTRQAIEAIIAQQATREARLSLANDVILNTGTQAELLEQVNILHYQYLRLSSPMD